MHYPAHDPKAYGAALEHAKDNRWDAFVQLGDFVENDLLSTYSVGRPGVTGLRTLREEFEAAGEMLHRGIIPAVTKHNKNASLWMLEGNHEQRTKREVEKNPHYAGMLDIPEWLGFDDIGMKWVEADSKGDVLRFEWARGKVQPVVRNESARIRNWAINYIHGWYYGAHFGKKTAERFPFGPIIQGHTHTIQSYTAEQWGPDSPVCHAIGCLVRKEMEYKKGRPKRWDHAVAEVTIADEGLYNVCVLPIRDGRLVSNGKVYTSKLR